MFGSHRNNKPKMYQTHGVGYGNLLQQTQPPVPQNYQQSGMMQAPINNYSNERVTSIPMNQQFMQRSNSRGSSSSSNQSPSRKEMRRQQRLNKARGGSYGQDVGIVDKIKMKVDEVLPSVHGERMSHDYQSQNLYPFNPNSQNY